MLMKWYNEPLSWEEDKDLIIVKTNTQSDFWRRLDCGYIRDNGHFSYQEVRGNFTAKVKIIVEEYQNQSGQAGLMIRVDEKTWLKSTIEFVEGKQFVSTVITYDNSDWSVAPLLTQSPQLWLCLQRIDPEIEVKYSVDDRNYISLKTACLTEQETVQVGLLCAYPDNDSCQVAFENLRIQNYTQHTVTAIAENLILIQEEEPDELQQFPRVFWLAVNVIEQLHSFRSWVKQTAEALGINTTSIGSKYFPHLTIGSAGPSGQGDWKLWDVHTVPKGATINLPISLEKLQAYKLHLTDVSIHPGSVHLLYLFRQ